MKTLNELYPGCGVDTLIKGIKINSKEVEKGDLFVCTMGITADRHEFIKDAVKNGAAAIIVSKDIEDPHVPFIKVPDTNRELPYLCQKFYDYPDQKLKLIATTGTDGKTTTASIIQTLLGNDICGYIGTNGRSCAGFKGDNPNTTPDAQNMYPYLDEFVRYGCRVVSLEASSEAFFRGRLQAMQFDVSIFTNITSEHMNIHKTFDNYLACKLQLFRQTKKDGYCIINRDEEHYEQVKSACNGKVLTYGMHEESTLRIINYTLTSKNTIIKFNYQNKDYEIVSPLLAIYNIYNLAAAILASLVSGCTMEKIIENIKRLHIDGRMEVLETNDTYSVIVDFAHTPNAISNVLNFAKSIDHDRIITVIGSAGGRDAVKRPVIGDVCYKLSDYTIFTTDDPRDEDPAEICKMMTANLTDSSRYETILDRSTAVNKAIEMATGKDIVLLLCKGNEPYQITKNGYEYYNEVEEAYIAISNKKLRNQ